MKTRAYGPTAVAKNICTIPLSIYNTKTIPNNPAGPRTNLKTFLTSAKGHLDLSFLCGFEIEFLIMHPAKDGNPPKAVQTEASPYSTASLRNPYFKVVEEIVACLIKSGIKVWQFHSEGSEGMFEITSGTLSPSLFLLTKVQKVLKRPIGGTRPDENRTPPTPRSRRLPHLLPRDNQEHLQRPQPPRNPPPQTLRPRIRPHSRKPHTHLALRPLARRPLPRRHPSLVPSPSSLLPAKLRLLSPRHARRMGVLGRRR